MHSIKHKIDERFQPRFQTFPLDHKQCSWIHFYAILAHLFNALPGCPGWFCLLLSDDLFIFSIIIVIVNLRYLVIFYKGHILINKKITHDIINMVIISDVINVKQTLSELILSGKKYLFNWLLYIYII